MNKEVKFFVCEHCGNLVEMVNDSGVPMMCCGQKMTELKPNTTDAAVEKHVPVVKVEGSQVTVEVSSVQHPMTEEHHIAWVCLQTEKGSQLKYLDPVGKPAAVFTLEEDKAVKVFAYCNLHGLWVADAK